jgi:hypothetical protein
MGRNWHEMKLTLTASCREYWGFFYQLDISWVLAHIITESFSCFQKFNRNVWSAELSARNLGQIILYLSRCPWSSWWPDISQWVVMAITAISWWRWWFDTFGSNSHKVMTELIAMLGNKIVITVLKWSDSHNEGEKDSFIWEVQTLGSICILKDHQNTCWHMNTCQTHLFKNGFWLFGEKPQLLSDWPKQSSWGLLKEWHMAWKQP